MSKWAMIRWFQLMAAATLMCALQPRLAPMRERVQWVTGARKVFFATLATEKKGAIERAA